MKIKIVQEKNEKIDYIKVNRKKDLKLLLKLTFFFFRFYDKRGENIPYSKNMNHNSDNSN